MKKRRSKAAALLSYLSEDKIINTDDIPEVRNWEDNDTGALLASLLVLTRVQSINDLL